MCDHVCCSCYALCRGPEGTSFDGGVFVTELLFPTDYPLSPPKMKFISEMFHPNGMLRGTATLDLSQMKTNQGIKYEEKIN